MRKILLGAAAAFAVAAPGIASADTTGNVGLEYSNTNWDDSEYDMTRLGGQVSFDAMPGWAVTLDGATAVQTWDGNSSDNSQGYFAVHADTTGNTWDFGGWAGMLNYYGNGGYTIGGEARTNFGNISVGGSIGYGWFDSSSDYNAWDLNLHAAYFFTPNFAINAGATGTWFDYSGDYESTDLSVGAQYGFGNGFEAYGGYLNSDWDSDYGSNEADVWNIGFRYHFNGGTLQDVTNDGASWNGVQLLSDAFTRWD